MFGWYLMWVRCKHKIRRDSLRKPRDSQNAFGNACNSVANAKKFFVGLATVLQTPKSFSWDLQRCCKHQKVFRETCNSVANARKFFVRLATVLQTPKSFSWDSQRCCKRWKVLRGTCSIAARPSPETRRLMLSSNSRYLIGEMASSIQSTALFRSK